MINSVTDYQLLVTLHTMDKYWTKKEMDGLQKAATYKDLNKVAMNVLQRIPRPTTQVCGPISTGGAGSIERNMQRMEKAIAHLSDRGHNVFNQLPFQQSMIRIIEREKNRGYSMALLTDFYQPIFESNLIHSLHFLPDWQSSKGATWEHHQAERLGIIIIYLELDWLNKI